MLFIRVIMKSQRCSLVFKVVVLRNKVNFIHYIYYEVKIYDEAHPCIAVISSSVQLNIQTEGFSLSHRNPEILSAQTVHTHMRKGLGVWIRNHVSLW